MGIVLQFLYFFTTINSAYHNEATFLITWRTARNGVVVLWNGVLAFMCRFHRVDWTARTCRAQRSTRITGAKRLSRSYWLYWFPWSDRNPRITRFCRWSRINWTTWLPRWSSHVTAMNKHFWMCLTLHVLKLTFYLFRYRQNCVIGEIHQNTRLQHCRLLGLLAYPLIVDRIFN